MHDDARYDRPQLEDQDQRKRRRFQRSRLRLPVDWRDWLLPAVSRGAAAVGFGVFPRVQEQLGDAALAAIALMAGAFAIGLAVLVWYSTSLIRRELVVDAIFLIVLVPAVSVASGIELADARFGGRSLNFLAATLAILAIFSIGATIASWGGSARGSVAQASVVSGGLVIAAVIGGASRFSGADLWLGVSLAWMVGGAMTLVAALLPPAFRGITLTSVYTMFGLVMLYTGLAGSGEPIEGSVATLAIMATVFPVLVLVALIPPRRRYVASIESAPHFSDDRN